MSLLSSFITDHLIKLLESEFIAHEGDLQDVFLKEMADASGVVAAWVEDKIKSKS